MKVVWCSANIHQVLFIDVVPGSHSTNHRIPIIDLTLNLTSIQEEDFEDDRFSLKTNMKVCVNNVCEEP